MAPDGKASCVSRRALLRLGGTAAMGVAGASGQLMAPHVARAQDVTFPNKVWNISGQDAFILPDDATQTYYRYTTGGPTVRLSKNLVDWSDAIPVWTNPPAEERWFSTEAPWACEVHIHNGRYYLFQTRHNSGTPLAYSELASSPDPYSVWHSQWSRATVIAVADSPMGPFVGLDNARPAHDPRFMTLDGTLIVDDEGPWMVYCHEWIQKMDGTVEAIPLTEDLSAAAGDPILICRGSDAPWRNHPSGSTAAGVPVINSGQAQPCVTDGCQLWRTPSGYLLMIWSDPGGSYSYNELQVISRTGSVRGPWEHVHREPFIHGNRGHGHIFQTFEGQEMLLVMNRSATGGQGSGTRSEYYEVEVTDEGVEVLRHRDDLDGQLGMDLADRTPPDLYLPPNQVVDATGPDGATLTYTATAHDWRDGPVVLSSSHTSGTTFPIGRTRIDFSATDRAGNLATASVDVHVKSAVEQIDDQIALVSSARPSSTSFVDQLESAQALVEEGRHREAREQLNAYSRYVKAQSGKAFSVSLADDLVANVTRIVAVLAG
jgi:hypothetical protein